MHLRKLSRAQMPAKTQIVIRCQVKGSSCLDVHVLQEIFFHLLDASI